MCKTLPEWKVYENREKQRVKIRQEGYGQTGTDFVGIKIGKHQDAADNDHDRSLGNSDDKPQFDLWIFYHSFASTSR